MKLHEHAKGDDGVALDYVLSVQDGISAIVNDARDILQARLRDLERSLVDRLASFIVATAEAIALLHCTPHSHISTKTKVVRRSVERTLAWPDDHLIGYAADVEAMASTAEVQEGLDFEALLKLIRQNKVTFIDEVA